MQIVHRVYPSTVLVFALSIAAGLVLAAPLPAEAQVEYEIIDLGTLPGGTESGAGSINELGEVTGSANVVGGETHAFIWLPAPAHGLPAGMTDLGTLDGALTAVFATGINNNGDVAVTARTKGNLAAYVWSAASGITKIGASGGFKPRETGAINESGMVAGASLKGLTSHGFVWDPTRGVIDLGALAAGFDSWASQINVSGQIVGRARDFENVARAYLITPEGDPGELVWNRDGNGDGVNDLMIDIGTLPDATGTAADGINSAGVVVGRSIVNNIVHAVAWMDPGNAAPMNLEPVGGSVVSSWAHGINDKMQIVGHLVTGAGAKRAFVWDSLQGMRDLNDLVAAPPGWVFTDTANINHSGQIVGGGLLNGVPRAFLLTPLPEDCLTDADCNDFNECNGAETCEMATGTCQDGTPVDCDDSDACTADSCDPATGACANDPMDPCCGDSICDAGSGEDPCNCPVDCDLPPAAETNCTDGDDEDCDGQIDCADPDCANDAACQSVCDGDGVCDADEDCTNCPNDCDGKTNGKPSGRHCCGNGVEEGPESDPAICDGNV